MNVRSPRALSVLAAGIAVVVVLAVVGDPVSWFSGSAAQRENPFAERELFVDPEAQGPRAARAAAAAGYRDADLIERVAAEPTGIWLTPEAVGIEEVEQRAEVLARQAQERGEAVVFVLYGIPDRDCSGGHSRGGLDATGYRTWVERAADGMSGHGTVAAIVEPDALAMLEECGDPQSRLELLDHAREVLGDAGVTTYLDAGHSAWIPVPQMAERLRAVGVEESRGFSVNVAAYQGEADEIAYAEELAAALGGVSYVMDTGRNGAGSHGQWCNPPGRALGERPGTGSGRLDARLWIKPPGESDGTCGGGPPAGQWWNERAVDLARAAGW